MQLTYTGELNMYIQLIAPLQR